METAVGELGPQIAIRFLFGCFTGLKGSHRVQKFQTLNIKKVKTCAGFIVRRIQEI